MSDSDGEYWACSNCGVELPRYVIERSTQDNPFPKYLSIDRTSYCPNCGTKMDLKENNG